MSAVADADAPGGAASRLKIDLSGVVYLENALVILGRAVADSGGCSYADRPPMPTSWTDDPATSSTHIRAVHINELRSAVDSNRVAAGLGAYPWTDHPVSSGTHMRAVHFGEVRVATQDLWYARRMGTLPDWSVGSPPSSRRPISARDMNDLWRWVNQYENQTGPVDPQGIVSFSYDPNASPPATVGDEWCQDLVALKPSGDRLLVRTKIVARTMGNDPRVAQFQAALDIWARNGFTVAGVLTGEFDQGVACPNAPLGQVGYGPLENAFIVDFAARVGSVASQLLAHGLGTYWVWNEPNVKQYVQGANCPPIDTSVAPEVFGALLYQAGTALQDAGVQTIYTGSLSLVPGTTDPNGALCAGYLDAMYQYLNDNGIFIYPWDALSVNVEPFPDGPDGSNLDNLITAIQGVQHQYFDFSPLVVGEWGSPNLMVDQPSAQAAYDALRARFSTMYFFQHPNLQTDHSLTDYGARDWSIQNATYIQGVPMDWYPVLQSLYQQP